VISALLSKWLVQETALPVEMPHAVRVFRTRWIPWLGGRLAGLKSPAAAVTLGDAILVHPDARITATLLRHELAHVQQWRARPFTFPLRYVIGHLRHGYQNNPYEREARAQEHIDSSQSTRRHT
jgi:hypothetical protein